MNAAAEVARIRAEFAARNETWLRTVLRKGPALSVELAAACGERNRGPFSTWLHDQKKAGTAGRRRQQGRPDRLAQYGVGAAVTDVRQGGGKRKPAYGDVMAPVGKAVRAANDWYQDQPEATEALLRVERFSGVSWDPACGIGTIPWTMHKAGLDVTASDIVDRGFGQRCGSFFVADFLKIAPPAPQIANIVSNPPFNLAQQFVECALVMASHKVAMLLPLTFLEGRKRVTWLETTPLARVHVFAWRISMPPGELLQTGAVRPEGGKKAFAWFVWDHGWTGPAQVRFLHKPATAAQAIEGSRSMMAMGEDHAQNQGPSVFPARLRAGRWP